MNIRLRKRGCTVCLKGELEHEILEGPYKNLHMATS